MYSYWAPVLPLASTRVEMSLSGSTGPVAGTAIAPIQVASMVGVAMVGATVDMGVGVMEGEAMEGPREVPMGTPIPLPKPHRVRTPKGVFPSQISPQQSPPR